MCPSPPPRWSLPNPEYYTLRYADGPQLYITEQVSVRGAVCCCPGQECRMPRAGAMERCRCCCSEAASLP